MLKMFRANPKEALDYFEKQGLDFSKAAKELDLGRLLIKEIFGMNNDLIDATEFVFWISYFAERELTDTILSIEKIILGKSTPMIEGMIDRLCFGDKISLVEKHYAGKSSADYIKILRKINMLRNDVAHGRLEELAYNNLPLSDAKGQTLLMADFMNAMHFKK